MTVLYFYIIQASFATTRCANFCKSKYDEVDKELEELDKGHDGEAEPQSENSTGVRDVLQQLTA